jgi:flagellar motor protein MotB
MCLFAHTRDTVCVELELQESDLEQLLATGAGDIDPCAPKTLEQYRQVNQRVTG